MKTFILPEPFTPESFLGHRNLELIYSDSVIPHIISTTQNLRDFSILETGSSLNALQRATLIEEVLNPNRYFQLDSKRKYRRLPPRYDFLFTFEGSGNKKLYLFIGLLHNGWGFLSDNLEYSGWNHLEGRLRPLAKELFPLRAHHSARHVWVRSGLNNVRKNKIYTKQETESG